MHKPFFHALFVFCVVGFGLIFGVDNRAVGAETAALSVSDAWIKHNPMLKRPSAAYMRLENVSDKTITIVAISAPDPMRAMMHKTIMQNGRSKMTSLMNLEIDPHEKYEFAPRGYHVMLMDIPENIGVGDEITLSFILSNGETIDHAFKLCPLTAESAC